MIAGLITAAVVLYTLSKQIKYPVGHLTKSVYNGFTSVVIVDKSIPLYKNEFFYQDKKISRADLAKSCAVSMEAVDYAAKNFGPKDLRSDKKVEECIFVFLDNEAFTKMLNAYGLAGQEHVQGFAVKIDIGRVRNRVYYCCYQRAKHMPEVCKRGQISVHEYLHAYSHKVSGNWDHVHSIWDHKVVDEKNIDKLAQERVTSIMTLDKSE
jgi:hypothetical protein